MGEKERVKLDAFTRLLPVIILVSINLLIGALTFQDYGESRDEPNQRTSASSLLDEYQSWLKPSYTPAFEGQNLLNKGMGFYLGVELAVRILRISDTFQVINFWHLSYFLAFQLGVLSLYFLSRRWMSDWAAFGTAILFSTQPLLWGHAFINPKDIPFLGFFLASMATGLWMYDRVLEPHGNSPLAPIPLRPLWERSRSNWAGMPRRTRRAALLAGLAWLLSVLFLTAGAGLINGWIADLVKLGYSSSPSSLMGRLFTQFASHAGSIPVDKYIQKAQIIFLNVRDGYILVAALVVAWLFHPLLPWTFRLPTRKESLAFLKDVGLAFTKPPLLLAGIVLGLTASIRVLGPLAGVIIVISALWGKGRRSIAPLLAYASVALLAMYLTWPYLWSSPISHLMKSIQTASDFPWQGQVFFNGKYYSPTALPLAYLPTLLAIQFTEPAVILFVAGALVAMVELVRRKRFEIPLMILAWFLFPAGAIILPHRTIYDNFRQLLFLIPPLFLLAGAALDALFRILRDWRLKAVLLVLLILPGVIAGVKLHPYEYIYYNSFVGGVDGAYTKYEMDYWMTSYRKAAEFLDANTPQNSRILVWLGYRLVGHYARPDLLIESETGNTYDLTGGYNYVVSSSRHGNADIYPSEPPILTISRGKAILTVVKHLSPTASP